MRRAFAAVGKITISQLLSLKAVIVTRYRRLLIRLICVSFIILPYNGFIVIIRYFLVEEKVFDSCVLGYLLRFFSCW